MNIVLCLFVLFLNLDIFNWFYLLYYIVACCQPPWGNLMAAKGGIEIQKLNKWLDMFISLEEEQDTNVVLIIINSSRPMVQLCVFILCLIDKFHS